MCGTGMAATGGKIIGQPRIIQPQNFAETFCHSRRSRKNNVIDALGLDAKVSEQRRHSFGNDLKKTLVPDPAILQRIVEATGP